MDEITSQQPKMSIKQQRDLKQEMKEQKRRDAARQNRMKNILTWSIIGVVIVAVVALVVISSRGNGTASTVAAVTNDDHLKGSQTATVTLVEYSDFQCPACGAYYPIVKGLEEQYGDKIALVFRNYPLTSIHQNAQLAAQAAEAANLQGKFWEMHDLLFDRQSSWSAGTNVKQTFVDYAAELKLDSAKFSSDIDSSTVKNRVSRDVDSGNAVGIAGTPTFFLNGKKISNPNTKEAFAKLIDEQLALVTNQ